MKSKTQVIPKVLLNDQLKRIKRQLHSARTGAGRSAKPSIRAGVSAVRREYDPKLYPQVIDGLWSSALYRSALAVTPFPRTYKVFNTHLRLVEIPVEAEFLWQGAILRKFATELSIFIAKKNEFEAAYARRDFPTAHSCLDSVEDQLGVSIWLISARLQLLQASSGLASQKTYLESTINTDGLNTWAAWLAYYFSSRSEENVSYSSLNEELSVALETKGVGDFLAFHLFPLDLATIGDVVVPLNRIEPYPIVDRYITYINMAKVFIARFGLTASHTLLESLALLTAIDDPELARLRIVLSEAVPESYWVESIGKYDDYFLGRLKSRGVNEGDNLELAARNLAYYPIENDDDPPTPVTLIEEAISLMRDVLIVADNYRSAISRLQKIALIFEDRNKSINIAAFLNKLGKHGKVAEIGELKKLSAISPALGLLSPAEITGITITSDRFIALADKFSRSATIGIIRARHASYEEGVKILSVIPLPRFRRSQLLGILAARDRKFSLAHEYFAEGESNSNEFVRIQAKRMQVNVFLTESSIGSALGMVVDHCLERSNAYHLYPIEEILRLALADNVLRGSVDTAILIHFAARNLSLNWERDLSDAYENVLGRLGIARPSQIFDCHHEWPSGRFIYFLRHVCVPRVLDDTVEFDSIDEIEQERILICQELIERDPANADVYSLEIRTITREATIFALLRTVESSKIYVDEDGIRSIASELLFDSFARYQQLSQSPELGYQAEKITKRIGKLLGDNAPDDIRSFMPPASEREGLFDGILHSFVNQFALNPAYGLDTHLSTTIRHGAFEGHIRAPLAEQQILTIADRQSGSWQLAKKWQLAFDGSEHLHEVVKHLQRFTTRVEEEIVRLNNRVIRVRSDEYPAGFFTFRTNKAHVDALATAVGATATFKDLVDRLLQFCWENVERSLKDIVAELHSGTQANINAAFDTLLKGLAMSADTNIRNLRDAIVRAKTDLQGALERISHWFNLPRDLFREPFELELAIDVALKQIHNCYVHSGVEANKRVSSVGKLPGKYLDGLVEIFFILVQNVILHSGISYEPLKIDFSVDVADNSNAIEIDVSNAIASSMPLEFVREYARNAVDNYKRDTAMQRARQEGGSGLSKVWRIAEYDLRCKHSMSISVGDDSKFHLSLSLEELH